MTNDWTAVLAPIEVAGSTPQIISTDCEITIRDGAPLLTVDGDKIGEVTEVSIDSGYIVARGVLLEGQDLPVGRPTFDVHPLSRQTIEEDPFMIRFETAEITSVRTGFRPCWDDPSIMFI